MTLQNRNGCTEKITLYRAEDDRPKYGWTGARYFRSRFRWNWFWRPCLYLQKLGFAKCRWHRAANEAERPVRGRPFIHYWGTNNRNTLREAEAESNALPANNHGIAMVAGEEAPISARSKCPKRPRRTLWTDDEARRPIPFFGLYRLTPGVLLVYAGHGEAVEFAQVWGLKCPGLEGVKVEKVA